jgi:hypothetical protein
MTENSDDTMKRDAPFTIPRVWHKVDASFDFPKGFDTSVFAGLLCCRILEPTDQSSRYLESTWQNDDAFQASHARFLKTCEIAQNEKPASKWREFPAKRVAHVGLRRWTFNKGAFAYLFLVHMLAVFGTFEGARKYYDLLWGRAVISASADKPHYDVQEFTPLDVNFSATNVSPAGQCRLRFDSINLTRVDQTVNIFPSMPFSFPVPFEAVPIDSPRPLWVRYDSLPSGSYMLTAFVCAQVGTWADWTHAQVQVPIEVWSSKLNIGRIQLFEVNEFDCSISFELRCGTRVPPRHWQAYLQGRPEITFLAIRHGGTGVTTYHIPPVSKDGADLSVIEWEGDAIEPMKPHQVIIALESNKKLSDNACREIGNSLVFVGISSTQSSRKESSNGTK